MSLSSCNYVTKQDSLSLEYRIYNYINNTLLSFNRFFPDEKIYSDIRKMNAPVRDRLVKSLTRKVLKDRKKLSLEGFVVEFNSNYFDEFKYKETISSKDRNAILILKNSFNSDFKFDSCLDYFRMFNNFNLHDKIIYFMELDQEMKLEYVRIDNYSNMLLSYLKEELEFSI